MEGNQKSARRGCSRTNIFLSIIPRSAHFACYFLLSLPGVLTPLVEAVNRLQSNPISLVKTRDHIMQVPQQYNVNPQDKLRPYENYATRTAKKRTRSVCMITTSSTLGEMGVDHHWITKHFIKLANHKLRNGLANHKLRLTETVY